MGGRWAAGLPPRWTLRGTGAAAAPHPLPADGGSCAAPLPDLCSLLSSPSPTIPSNSTPRRQIADELIEEAKSQLEGYAPARAAPLYALAEYIRSRKN